MICALLVAGVVLQVPVVLSTVYGDGRTSRHVITAQRTNAWTPYFSKTAEWRSADGLSVAAINYWYVLEDDGVHVKISLFLGRSNQREIDVASVVVTRENPVRVTALEQYGVEPVVLSLSEFEPRSLAPPRVENKTASIHVESVEMSGGTRPGYQIRIRNYASKPIMTFYVEASRDDKPGLLSRRGERDGTPIVAAGETHTFFLPTEHPLEVVRITGLMFEDGSIEGDASGVATTRVTYFGRRVLFGEVVAIFQDAFGGDLSVPDAVIATLTSRVEALPVTPDVRRRQSAAALLPPEGRFTSALEIDGALGSAMAATRRGVLSDLQGAPREAAAFRAWLGEITAQYSKWYHRFVELTAR
jgi:hypothetical protein